MRMKNSEYCGKPFNNRTVKNGEVHHLPTIWIFNTCVETTKQMRNWRRAEYINRNVLVVKDQKDEPQQKNSHFPMTLECLLKSPALALGRYSGSVLPVHDRKRRERNFAQEALRGNSL